MNRKDAIRRLRIPFCMVENALTEVDLSIYGKMIYTILCIHSNSEDRCWPGYNTLAREAGCCRSKAMRAIQELIDKEIIDKQTRVSKKGQISNLYLIKGIPSVPDTRGGVSDTRGESTTHTGGSVSGTPEQYPLNKNKEQKPFISAEQKEKNMEEVARLCHGIVDKLENKNTKERAELENRIGKQKASPR